MNLNELKAIVDAQVEAGQGLLTVIAGDMNKMHCAVAAELCLISNLEDRRYLEEVHPDDNHDNSPCNAFVIGI